jgi:hypothetical protein
MEVVTTNPIRGTSCYTTVMNEAWRIFCIPIAIGTGTIFLSYTSVAVQGLLRAGNKSRYTKFYRKQVRELALSGAKDPDLSRFTKLSK